MTEHMNMLFLMTDQHRVDTLLLRQPVHVHRIRCPAAGGTRLTRTSPLRLSAPGACVPGDGSTAISATGCCQL